MMKLAAEDVVRFQGGQMEMQNPDDGYIYRGEIETITVENGKLKVTFAWLAKGVGYPPIPIKWVKCGRFNYMVSLEICSVQDIGPSDSEVGGDNRLLFDIFGEVVVLFPPNGSKLDRSKVEGL